MEGKRGVKNNTKEICKMVPWPRRLYAGLYSKESGTDKIRITAGYRVMKFEEKALKRR